MPVRIRNAYTRPPQLAASKVLSENSWETISAIAENHQASKYWKVGDEIDIKIDYLGTYTFQIYGFDIDDKADGSGKAGITFGMKNLLAERLYMNVTYSTGWGDSYMRTGLIPLIYENMPNEVKTVIKPVNKITAKTTLNGYAYDYSLETTEDELFLFAEKEVGLDRYSNEIEYNVLPTYPIFNDSNNLVKTMDDGYDEYPATWWLRSPTTFGSTYFVSIDDVGQPFYDAISSSNGVCFGFCV